MLFSCTLYRHSDAASVAPYCSLFLYYSQDGNPTGCGTVTEIGNFWRSPGSGHVTVQWDTGETWNYRMGYDGCYELCLADEG